MLCREKSNLDSAIQKSLLSNFSYSCGGSAQLPTQKRFREFVVFQFHP